MTGLCLWCAKDDHSSHGVHGPCVEFGNRVNILLCACPWRPAVEQPALPDFVAFKPIPRLRREIVITEKIDGMNACVLVPDDGPLLAGSRTQWVIAPNTHYGFGPWVQQHAEELRTLGPGTHFGEWWGPGLGRRDYGLPKHEKRFSLFNTHRWSDDATRPACCGVVPVLYQGVFSESAIEECLWILRTSGSRVAPDFKRPEGIVVFHTAANALFKITLENDASPKSLAP